MGRGLTLGPRNEELAEYRDRLRKRLAKKAETARAEELNKLSDAGIKPLGRGIKRK